MKCSNCGEDYQVNAEGSKRIPKPLCKTCVIKTAIFECSNCHSQGCVQDEFFNTECFECGKNGCSVCIPYQVWCEGMTFDFCKQHKDCRKDKMKETAKELRKEFPDDLQNNSKEKNDD